MINVTTIYYFPSDNTLGAGSLTTSVCARPPHPAEVVRGRPKQKEISPESPLQTPQPRPFPEGHINIGRFSHMTDDDMKLFGCLTCGFRVSSKTDSCPRCGARFGSEAKFECPFCGEPVERDTEVCPSCNIRYVDFVAKAEEKVTNESIDDLLTEIIEMEAKNVKEEAKKLSCPKCSWMVGESEENCPKCGNAFAENVTYMCPVCAALVHFETTKCDECGSVFVEEDKEQEVQVQEIPAVAEAAPAQDGEPETEEAVVTEEPPVAPEPEPEPEVVEPPPTQVVEEEPEPVAEETVPEEAPVSAEPVAEETRQEAKEETAVDDVQEEKPAEPAVTVKRVRRRKLKAKPDS